MPALDRCHEQVVRALEKENWRITSNPKYLYITGRAVFIDLEAKRGHNGSLQEILLVEVKCFAEATQITRDLYLAIGQYVVYQAILKRLQISTPLFLTMPLSIYDTIVDEVLSQVLHEYAIKVLVVDMQTEEIVRWIV